MDVFSHKSSTPILVGLTGLKQSGKSTFASRLVFARKFKEVSFAAPMRSFIADILGVSLPDLERMKSLPIAWLDGVEPRWLLQTVGTEWGRNMIHPEIWVRRAMRHAHDLMKLGNSVVISDCRFDNEAVAIKQAGGRVMRIVREGQVNEDTHASEAGISDSLIDETLHNVGSIADLISAADMYVPRAQPKPTANAATNGGDVA